MVGDISKAHRRFKHREEEHGYLGCQIDASEEIPVDPESQNKVVTFGVSYSYWRTATHHLLGPEFMLDLLLYAGDLSLGLGASGSLGGKGFRLATATCRC